MHVFFRLNWTAMFGLASLPLTSFFHNDTLDSWTKTDAKV